MRTNVQYFYIACLDARYEIYLHTFPFDLRYYSGKIMLKTPFYKSGHIIIIVISHT